MKPDTWNISFINTLYGTRFSSFCSQFKKFSPKSRPEAKSSLKMLFVKFEKRCKWKMSAQSIMFMKQIQRFSCHDVSKISPSGRTCVFFWAKKVDSTLELEIRTEYFTFYERSTESANGSHSLSRYFLDQRCPSLVIQNNSNDRHTSE